jgi:CRP-like cAMP-binding protein
MDRDEIFFEAVNFLEENSCIDACSSRATKEQEVIFNQGASRSDLYVIKSGSFVVSDSRGKELVLAALNRGDVFGEMAFFRS